MAGPAYNDVEWDAEFILGTFQPFPFSFTTVWKDEAELVQFIDREVGLCGLYGCQVRPPGDLKVGKLITLFEKTMYERLAAHEAKAKL